MAATFAAFSVITQLGLMYLKAPQRAGLAALEVCDSMPAVTFAWANVRVGGHHHMDEASDADRALLSDQDYNLLSAPVAAPELDAKSQQAPWPPHLTPDFQPACPHRVPSAPAPTANP